jgi:exodeoxyribonuclease V gamma subunit
LQKYKIEQELISQRLDGGDALAAGGDFLLRAQIAGDWPLGTSGELSFTSKETEISRFVEQISTIDIGKRCPAIQIDCTVGEYQLRGQLDNVYEKGILIVRYGKLRGRDLLSAWLHHLVMQQVARREDHTTCLATVDGIYTFSAMSPGPDLISLLDHFRLGQSRPSELYLEPAFVYAKQLRGRGKITPIDKARAYLMDQLEKGYEQELQLLLQNLPESELLGESFETLATDVMLCLLENADG